MKTGFTFTNSGMKLTLLGYAEIGANNAALLICHNDGLFITVRGLSQEPNGSYSWAWGHYFSDIREALTDFDERTKFLE